MKDVKFRIRLKNKIDKQVITLCVPLFDEKNGLMQFPIDLNEWEVLSVDRYFNIDGIDLWENDIIEGKTLDHMGYIGKVVFEDGTFAVETTDSKAPILYITSFQYNTIKRISSIWDNPELLEDRII